MAYVSKILLALSVIGCLISVNRLASSKIIIRSVVVMTSKDRVLCGRSTFFGKTIWVNPDVGVGKGETVEEAAARAVKEMTGIEDAALKNVGKVAIVQTGPAIPGTLPMVVIIEVYVTEVKESDVKDTGLRWFSAKDLPYDEMWAHDRFWMPHALKHQKFEALFHLEANGFRLVSKIFETAKRLDNFVD